MFLKSVQLVHYYYTLAYISEQLICNSKQESKHSSFYGIWPQCSKTVLTGLGGGGPLCWKTKSSSLLRYIMKLFLALPQHPWLVQTVNGLWLHIFTSQTASNCNQKEPCHPYRASISICLCFCSQADRVSLNYIKH